MNAPLKDPLVLFMPSGRRGRFPVGTPVLDAARSLGVYIESVCGGRGICGRCQIQVQEGEFAKHGITSSQDHLSPFSDTEARYVRIRGELENQRRLSCHATIQGDLVVDVPQDVQINRQIVRKRAETRLIERDPITQLCYVEVDEPDMHKPLGDTDRMLRVLAKDWHFEGLRIDFDLLPKVQKILREGEWKVTAAVHHDRSGPVVTALWPGLHNFACGIAVDIGSTTIACHLSALLSGRTLASAGIPNPQIRFGEDLMSRVSYVMMNPDGREAMTKAVREAIGVLIEKVCSEAGVPSDEIIECVFVGNPIMHHLFLGIDPTELGGAPFALAVSDALNFRARDIGLPVNEGARVYTLPCIAGHVGADAGGRNALRGSASQRGDHAPSRCRHQRRDRARQQGPAGRGVLPHRPGLRRRGDLRRPARGAGRDRARQDRSRHARAEGQGDRRRPLVRRAGIRRDRGRCRRHRHLRLGHHRGDRRDVSRPASSARTA